jgi:hypothetical protein
LLRELSVSAGRGVADVAEAVRAKNCTSVDDNAIAERGSGIENGARIDAALLADADAVAHDSAGLDAGSRADAGSLADDGACSDGDIHSQVDLGTNNPR